MICVAGFLSMSNLDIVHISSAYVHVICILSEHIGIMHILSALVLDIFLPNRQCQCDLYVISSTLYRSLHVVHTYTHYLLCIFHIPYTAYYLQLSFRILSPYIHVICTSSIHHLHCYPWSIWTLFTYYLHMYMSSTHYLGICILCAHYSQWSLISSFLTDNADVIHMSSLLLFIHPIMYNLVSAHCLHRRTLSMLFACYLHM